MIKDKKTKRLILFDVALVVVIISSVLYFINKAQKQNKLPVQKSFQSSHPLLIQKTPDLNKAIHRTLLLEKPKPKPKTKNENKPKEPDLNDSFFSSVQERQSQIERCHLNRLQEVGQLNGVILIGVVILPDGKVEKVKTLKSDIEDQKLLSCLHSIFKRIRFKSFMGKKLYRSFPIDFE